VKQPTFDELLAAKNDAISFISENGMEEEEIAYFSIQFGISCIELSVPYEPLVKWWETVPESVELPILIMLYSMKRDSPESYNMLMKMMGVSSSKIDLDKLMGFNA
jgi:hypothetical protein